MLTSDFRLTVRIGNQTVDQIRTVKYVQSLTSQRVLEKFEIAIPSLDEIFIQVVENLS